MTWPYRFWAWWTGAFWLVVVALGCGPASTASGATDASSVSIDATATSTEPLADGAPPDAPGSGATADLDSATGERTVDDASADGGSDGATDDSRDAPLDTFGVGSRTYVPQAPHCKRAPDAGAPAPFDSGAGDAARDALALPLVLNLGGPVLEAPTFVSVTFPGDEHADELDDFVGAVGCTDYWASVASDYGVGTALSGPAVRLTEEAPSSIDDEHVRAWLVGKIDGGDAQFPRPAPETVYVIWYPELTQVTHPDARDGGPANVSCSDFEGYHGVAQLADATPFWYVVVPRCATDGGTPQRFGDHGPISALTEVGSHELIEACTDADGSTNMNVAYGIEDDSHPGNAFVMGSEVADMCETAALPFLQPVGFPWFVQRVWSNRAASAGSDPCVPGASRNFAYAAAIAPDTMVTDVTGLTRTVSVIHIPVGSTGLVTVQLITSPGYDGCDTQTVWASPVGSAKLDFSPSVVTSPLAARLTMRVTKNAGDPVLNAEAFVIGAHSACPGDSTPASFSFAVTSD